MRKGSNKTPILYIGIVLLVAYLVSNLGRQVPEKKDMTLSKFVEILDQGQVVELKKQGSIYTGMKESGEEFSFYSSNENFYENYLKDLVDSNKISYREEAIPATPWYIELLPTIFLLLVMVGIWYLFMTKTQGGGSGMMNFAKSQANLHKDDLKKRVTFNDVAGLKEEKEELSEIVDFLKNPKKYTELGARIPKGVLLVGSPGTGKTYLSRAVAGEAGVPFFSISGSDFVEMFVGVGASRVRDLFNEAKKNAPCIIFIDEIDAVGRKRGAGLGGGHDEREQTLNQLLVEMDGFETNEGIIIMAATNRADILDPALLRPGRFDRNIHVGLPDVRGREEILLVHTRNKKLEPDVDLKAIAKTTGGFSPADLENLANEAALLTARANKKAITRDIFEEAAIKVVAGPEKKSKVVIEKERIITAYHEAGHAIVSRLMPNTDPVHMITIIPRGRAGGFTAYIPQEENNYYSRSGLIDRLSILLGGRAAEAVVLRDISSGASNDIERATELARYMVSKVGMSDKLGPINYDTDGDNVFLGDHIGKAKNFSDQVAYAIDMEVKTMIDEAYDKAKQIIDDNLELLHRLSQDLLERETLNSDEFEELFQKYHVGPDPKDEEVEEIINYDLLVERGIISNKPEIKPEKQNEEEVRDDQEDQEGQADLDEE